MIDVLYSAAGNSADEAYYNHGIIGYDFEIGATQVCNDTRHRLRRPAARSAPPFGASTATPTSSTRATTRAWSSPTATTALLQLRAATTRTTRRRRSSAPTSASDGNAHLHGQVHVQRGVLDLLHDRRLDADHGLDRVEAARAPRALPLPLDLAPGTKLKWIAEGLQGQHVRRSKSQVLGQTDTPGTVGGTVPAHAGADARRAGDVRRVHARRREDLHGLDHGHRDLHRG